MCVLDRVVRGVRGRQGDAPHRVGPERVDGDCGRGGRVDAARQRDPDVAEPVLVHVVAGREHERCPGLAEVVRPWRHLADLGACASVEVEVRHDEVLGADGAAGADLPIGTDDERVAVEHDLVLPADLVDVQHERVVAFGVESGPGLTHRALAAGVRRGVGDHDDAGALGGIGERSLVGPHVLAHRQPDRHPGHVHDHGLVGRREVPGLVEDAVVRQSQLAVRRDDLAVTQERRGVVEVARRHGRVPVRLLLLWCEVGGVVVVDVPEHQRTAVGSGRRQVAQCLLLGVDEVALQQQVLRWVAGQHQLGRNDQVGPRIRGPTPCVQDERRVARDVSDGGVALGKCDAQGHVVDLPRRIRTVPHASARPPAVTRLSHRLTAWTQPPHGGETADS